MKIDYEDIDFTYCSPLYCIQRLQLRHEPLEQIYAVCRHIVFLPCSRKRVWDSPGLEYLTENYAFSSVSKLGTMGFSLTFHDRLFPVGDPHPNHPSLRRLKSCCGFQLRRPFPPVNEFRGLTMSSWGLTKASTFPGLLREYSLKFSISSLVQTMLFLLWCDVVFF